MLSGVKLYSQSGMIEGKGVRNYKYDLLGNRTEFSSILKGQTLWVTTYQYDSLRRLIKETYTDPASREQRIKTFIFNNKRIERVHIQRFSVPSLEVSQLLYENYVDFEYDIHGNKVFEITKDATFKEESRWSFEYRKF